MNDSTDISVVIYYKQAGFLKKKEPKSVGSNILMTSKRKKIVHLFADRHIKITFDLDN